MFFRERGRHLSLQEKGAIIALSEQGLLPGEIAERFDCHRTTIVRWIKRHDETLDVTRKLGSGRPKSTTIAEDEMLLDAVRTKPLTSSQEIKGKLYFLK